MRISVNHETHVIVENILEEIGVRGIVERTDEHYIVVLVSKNDAPVGYLTKLKARLLTLGLTTKDWGLREF